MPQRQGKKQIDTPVQGDDAYVVVTKPHVGEIEKILKIQDDAEGQFGQGIEILQKHIVDWNWVDEDGERLPSPRENPEIVRELTADEYQALVSVLLGAEEDRKN